MIDLDFGVTVLAMIGFLHAAAEMLGHELHAVANAQDGKTQIPDSGIRTRRVRGVNARRSPGKDQSGSVLALNLFERRAKRKDFTIDLGLAHPAGDELRVLAAKVENNDHDAKPIRYPLRAIGYELWVLPWTLR